MEEANDDEIHICRIVHAAKGWSLDVDSAPMIALGYYGELDVTGDLTHLGCAASSLCAISHNNFMNQAALLVLAGPCCVSIATAIHNRNPRQST